jgi:hypothetical protein
MKWNYCHMAVISTSLNKKTFFVRYAMPFKYRDKRNAYFKDYMRKRRAEEKKNQAVEESSANANHSIDQPSTHEDKISLEIVAA